MPVHPEGLDERHGSGDAADELLVDLGRRRGSRRGLGYRRRRRGNGDRRVPIPSVSLQPLEQEREPGLEREQLLLRSGLEERTPLRGDGAGIVEVLLEEQCRIARVEPVDL